MAFKATDFENDTDLERFALDLLGLHRVRVGKPRTCVHAEASPAVSGSAHLTLGVAEAVERAREELRQSLRPLGFGAAYKILDMLVEHVLLANGVAARGLRFAEKNVELRKLGKRSLINLPVPLAGRPDLWERIAEVYLALQDARHAVTHRPAKATPCGDLDYEDKNGPTATISSAELAAFAKAVDALAKAVIDVDSDPRLLNIVAWNLNTLGSRHRLPSLPATDPDAGWWRLIMDLIPLDGSLVQFDLARAREIVAGEPGHCDLKLLHDARVFVARWENVPNVEETEIDFDPASPPAWLSEQMLLELISE